MSCSGLQGQEMVIDEAGVLTLLTHQSSNPRTLSLCSRPVSFTLRLLTGVVLGVAAARLALDMVLRGWEEWCVLCTPRSFQSPPPPASSFTGFTFLPYRRLFAMSIPAGNYFSGQVTATPHPSLKACLSACRGAVHWVEKSEVAGLSELVPGSLTCSLSPPHLGWTWGVSLLGPLL